jgi:hypothetical protein
VFTAPVAAFTVATEGLLLLHTPVPPPKTTPLAVYVVDAPMHRGEDPVIEVIAAFGVTVIVPDAVVGDPHPPVVGIL